MKTIKKIIKIILVIVFLVAIFLSPRFIKIKKIECSSQFGECNKTLVSEFQEIGWKSLSSSIKDVKQIIAWQNIVKEYEIFYEFPYTLKIYVVEKKPFYALKSKTSNLIALLDKDGEVISLSEATNLPIVMIDDKLPNVKERVDDKVLFALNIVNLTHLYYDIKDPVIQSQELYFFDQRGNKVIFPLEGDLYRLIGAYNLIYSRLDKILEEAKIIDEKEKHSFELDLRYKNAILRKIS